MMQKVKEKVNDYENHLKGKESTDKEVPHPEFSHAVVQIAKTKFYLLTLRF
jgi:hypothetical protein